MSRKFDGVDMDAAVKYMVKHGCKLDEAIAAVSRGTVKENLTVEPVGKSDKLPKQVVKESFTTEKLIREKPKKVEQPKTKLKAARIKAGLSQSELARGADINIRTLQAYEQGYKSFDNARLETILKVSVACACKLEDIIESPTLLELLKSYNEKML